MAVQDQAIARALPSARPKQLLIDGDWVEAASGRTFETIDPATEDVLAQVAHGGPRTSSAPCAPRGAPSRPTRSGAGCRPRTAVDSSTASAT
jgi:hypothetical protein